jgi:diphosphomevalonate decarboxylase
MTLNKQVTVSAPVNIAVIKYWGKRDESLILPTNSSLSVTLQDLKSFTTVALSEEEQDEIWLNGTREKLNKRVAGVLHAARKRREELEEIEGLEGMACKKLKISSRNNFPTAAGLASSASGYAALAFALANFYDLDYSIQQLSRIARMGSGSACVLFSYLKIEIAVWGVCRLGNGCFR